MASELNTSHLPITFPYTEGYDIIEPPGENLAFLIALRIGSLYDIKFEALKFTSQFHFCLHTSIA